MHRAPCRSTRSRSRWASRRKRCGANVLDMARWQGAANEHRRQNTALHPVRRARSQSQVSEVSGGGGLTGKKARNEAQLHVRPPQDVSGASRGVRHGEQLLSGAPPPPTATAHESTTSTEDTCVEPVERFGRRPYCHRPQLLGSGSGGGQKLGRHVLQPARQALHGAHQPRVGRGQVLEP